MHAFQTQCQTVTCDGAFIIGFFKQFVIKQTNIRFRLQVVFVIQNNQGYHRAENTQLTLIIP